ncbi:MAG: hypothetical protein RIB80_16740 [Rhodospirillales bacterium]
MGIGKAHPPNSAQAPTTRIGFRILTPRWVAGSRTDFHHPVKLFTLSPFRSPAAAANRNGFCTFFTVLPIRYTRRHESGASFFYSANPFSKLMESWVG